MTDHDPLLVSALDSLETRLPSLLDERPDETDFWPAFNREADGIRDDLEGDDLTYAQGRIDCMLKNAGLIPGEDEGSPCAR